jgi:tetraacyldisaccharide 4'-kinase
MARVDGRPAVNPLVRRALDAWYGDGAPPLWARMCEPLYRGVVRMRRAAYVRGWRASGHPGRPVIVVGNLTAGGAGKTPLVAWLARALQARGLRPAVVSRGYGGAEPLSPHQVLVGDDAAFSGDEPLLLASLADCPVWICRDRLAAARAAVGAGADVIVADDGLQHYRLQRDFELVVIDAERGLGNGRCLPAGPLREPAGRLQEVDFIVCNGAGSRCPDQGLRMELVGTEAARLDGRERRPLEHFRPGPVHAVAGIGHPERFFRFLEAHGLEIIRHPLPDHAPIPEALLSPADGRAVLMTSKDAMRCMRQPAAAGTWQVPVEARLEQDGRPLLDRLARTLGMREA